MNKTHHDGKQKAHTTYVHNTLYEMNVVLRSIFHGYKNEWKIYVYAKQSKNVVVGMDNKDV